MRRPLLVLLLVSACDPAPPAPVMCEPGTFDDGSACVAWSSCAAGTFLATEGDATHDRTCSACAPGTFSASPNASACEPYRECPAGEAVQRAGGSTTDTLCAACATGTFSVEANAPRCAAFTTCAAGAFIGSDGTPTRDRTCTPCASGTWSGQANAAACQPFTVCPAGKALTMAGTPTSDARCTTCMPGTFCAGGEATPLGCGDGWDHDGNAATPCVARVSCAPGARVTSDGNEVANRTCAACTPATWSGTTNAPACAAWSTCVAGERVVFGGSATVDRTCAACAPGTFSSASNAATCSPWTVCLPGYVEHLAGTSTSDRTCWPFTWLRELGATTAEWATGVRADAAGNVFVVGVGSPAFLHKYDGAGTLLWSRTLASGGFSSVAIAPTGDVLVSGSVTGVLPGQLGAGGSDAFVRKYTSAGVEVWTRQFGTSGLDDASAVSVGADGAVFVVGVTTGAFPGFTTAGSFDAFVRKYDSAGALLWQQQLGTAASDHAVGAVEPSGGVVLVGTTSGVFPGQVGLGGSDAWARRYDANGLVLWTRQFGTSFLDEVADVAVDPLGRVYVAGRASVVPTLWAFDAVGSLVWTRSVGGAVNDVGGAVAVDATGRVLFAGATDGVPGHPAAGGKDVFVREYDAAGNVVSTRQFGSSADDAPLSVCFDPGGAAFVAGLAGGPLPAQPFGGDRDAFVGRLAP